LVGLRWSSISLWAKQINPGGVEGENYGEDNFFRHDPFREAGQFGEKWMSPPKSFVSIRLRLEVLLCRRTNPPGEALGVFIPGDGGASDVKFRKHATSGGGGGEFKVTLVRADYKSVTLRIVSIFPDGSKP
jgi:hypothetical protein